MLNKVRSACTFLGVRTTPSEGSEGPVDTLPEVLLEVLLEASRSALLQVTSYQSLVTLLLWQLDEELLNVCDL